MYLRRRQRKQPRVQQTAPCHFQAYFVVISQTRWLVSRVRLAPDGWNRPIYFVHSGAICPVVVPNRSWCVTPHSSPTRGCWPRWPLQPILNILNIFTINIYIHLTGNRCIISKFCYFAGIYPASLPPWGDHVTPCGSGSLFDCHGVS